MTPDLLATARQWAHHLPREFARTLAEALVEGPEAVRALRGGAALPASHQAVEQALVVALQDEGPLLAGLLLGRLEAAAEQPTVTAVWTGPESTTGPARLTLAVVADLIDSAAHELVLVSYATYPSSEVRQALDAAAARGVTLTLLLERSADNPSFHGINDPFPGLHARRLVWPISARPAGASIHAKILVIDRRLALIGSANLTGMAMLHNLECGLLVRGGTLPEQVARHLLEAAALQAHEA